MSIPLRGLLIDELSEHLKAIGQQPFRAKQIFNGLYRKNSQHLSDIKGLPAKAISVLAKQFSLNIPSIEKESLSNDGCRKILLKLEDDVCVETVLLPSAKRNTACISTQAGCKLGCTFCATGHIGFKRNLSAAEIIDQVMALQAILEGERLDNIVFMGMGEPLLNLDNVLQAVKILKEPQGFGFSPQRVTISTVGITPQILNLAQQQLPLRLAISLNAAEQKQREEIMPIAKQYPLSELLRTAESYFQTAGRRVSLEYVMLRGFNDREEDLKAIDRLLHGRRFHINLIRYNYNKDLPFKPSLPAQVENFKKGLVAMDYPVSVRQSMGSDIKAACGQLAANQT